MLSYQKNSLLSLLAQFKVKLLEHTAEKITFNESLAEYNAVNIIDRNLTSIEKQVKKL